MWGFDSRSVLSSLRKLNDSEVNEEEEEGTDDCGTVHSLERNAQTSNLTNQEASK